MTKAELRQEFPARQKNLSPTERSKKSLEISERFFAEFSLQTCRVLHLFLAIKKNNEIETSFILKRLWQDFPLIKTVAPRVNFEKTTLEHIELKSASPIFLNRWQIPEPTDNLIIESKEIDIVLVPLVAFDERGFRVGYGKGFYDKFLGECRADCLKIGLSYFPPIDEITDVADFDVKLDFCLTPEKTWKF